MSDALWGRVDRHGWRSVPSIQDRIASERDVQEGRAVFFVRNPDEVSARPAEISIPCLALQKEAGTGKQVPVIVIQAVEAEGECTVGVRYFDGGNGACLLSELEIIEETDHRFEVSPHG